MNWKHYRTGEVISNECYHRLPDNKKMDYNSVFESPTHRVEDDSDDWVSTAIAATSIASSLFSDDSSSSSSFGSSSSDSSSNDFGGGDFGGGGASGDW